MAGKNQTELTIATIRLFISLNAQIACHESDGGFKEYVIGDSKTVRYSVGFNRSTNKYEICIDSNVICSETDNTLVGREIKKLYDEMAAAYGNQMTHSRLQNNRYDHAI